MSCTPLCIEIMIEIAIGVITLLRNGMSATNTTMGMVLMKEHETHKIYKETTDRNGKEKMFMMMMIFGIETSMHGFTEYCNCNHNKKNGVRISL